MKKNIWLHVIRFLLIALFASAAITKLAEFPRFVDQLSQISFFTHFPYLVAVVVPLAELVVVGLLLFPRVRMAGLYGSFFLMLAFTVYLYVLQRFGNNVVCSCGGIISSLSTTQHFWFNVTFMILSGVGVCLYPAGKKHKKISQRIIAQ